MAEGCTHNCSTCSKSDCASKNQIVKEKLNPRSTVKHVIGVVSGKGGVGKSLVTGMLSVLMQRMGFNTAIIDADITGPSIPKMFGVNEGVEGDENGLIAPKTASGIEMISANLLLQDETQPVIWRGPVIAGMVKQFWTDVVWEDIDVMFIDCPPGTGDVPLTVFQTIPLDAAVVVTTPQDLVSMIVRKAVNMAQMMNINVLGIVENMSYIECPDCKKKISVFGKLGVDSAAGTDLPVLAKMPITTMLTELVDNGEIEKFDCDWLDDAVAKIEEATKDKE